MMDQLKNILLTLAGLGLLIYLWSDQDTPSHKNAYSEISTQLTDLEARVISLEHQIESLGYQPESFRDSVTPEARPGTAEQTPKTLDLNNSEVSQSAETRKNPLLEEKRLSWQTIMRNSGIANETILQIENITDTNRMAQLELRHRASREGWINSPDYLEQSSALRNNSQTLREQIGDSVYDHYLYANDQANRVKILQVYKDSAAEAAGLLPGDLIISYAGSPIYKMQQLQKATLEGQTGEAVLIQAERNGFVISTSVPRGPLGISMSMETVKPEAY